MLASASVLIQAQAWESAWARVSARAYTWAPEFRSILILQGEGEKAVSVSEVTAGSDVGHFVIF